MAALRPVVCAMLVVFAGACNLGGLGKKSGDDDDGPNPAPSVVTLKVVDGTDDQPLKGVRVFAGDQPRGVTDGNGELVLSDMSAAERMVFRFEADGYADGVMPSAVHEGSANELEVLLVPAAVSSFPMAQGGTVTDGNGGEARFAANSMVRPDGQPATGMVSVTLVALDPTRDDGLKMFPGDFAATRMDGSTEILDTFAPINITAREGDAHLNLAPGQKAAVRIPVPPNRIDEAPDQMPMWSLDPTTGSWKEDGIMANLTADAASPSGFSYVAEVPHLSWWNMDMSAGVACLKGCVRTASNQALSNVAVTATGNRWQRDEVTTNSSGCFAVNMPTSAEVSIVAKRGSVSVTTGARTGATPSNTMQSRNWAACKDIGMLTLSVCSAGERRCAGRTPELCEASAGRWIKQPICPKGCFQGRCTECMPGSEEKSCDGNRLRICGADGRWTATTCPSGCYNGACGRCKPGARACQGLGPVICNGNGQWQAEGAACPRTGRCSLRPLADGSRCYKGQCEPDTALACEGNAPVTCDPVGRRVVGKACATACLGGACAQCSPGKRGCGLGGEPLLCLADGTWAPMGEKCPFVCDLGICAGECKPGSKRCAENQRQTCNDKGRWLTDERCAFGCTESAGATACAGECRPGQKTCQGSVARLCTQEAKWIALATCNIACRGGECMACDSSEVRCEGNVPYARNAQCSWVAGAPCPEGCWQGRCGPAPCFPTGNRKCQGNAVLVCGESGSYEPLESCATGCSAGTCTSCQPGQKQCTDKVLRTCSEFGEWEEAPCPEGCEGGSCRGGVVVPGACGTLSAAEVPPVVVRGDAAVRPSATGGVIVPGSYYLISSTLYGSSAAPGLPPISALIRFDGTRYESVLRAVTSDIRSGGTYVTTGTTFSWTQTCPQAGAGNNGYSVEGDSIVAHDWPLPGVHVFRRRATTVDPTPTLPDAGPGGTTDGGAPTGCSGLAPVCLDERTLVFCSDGKPMTVDCPSGCAINRCNANTGPDGGVVIPPTPDAGPGDQMCTGLELGNAQLVAAELVDGGSPPAQGGLALDGTYQLVAGRWYDAPAGSVMPRVAQVLRIRGGRYETVTRREGQLPERASGDYFATGTTLQTIPTCPDPEGPRTREYTAAAGEIQIYEGAVIWTYKLVP